MYIQYKDDLNNIYYIDTSENPLSYFLLTFNWTIKRKVYISKKLILKELAEKKKRIRLIAFYISTPLGIVLAEYTELSNDVLYKLNYIQSACLFISIYLLLLIIFIMINKFNSRKLEKKQNVSKEKYILIRMKPRSKLALIGCIIWFLILIELVRWIIPFFQTVSIESIYLFLFIIICLIAFPYCTLSFMIPNIPGRKINRIE